MKFAAVLFVLALAAAARASLGVGPEARYPPDCDCDNCECRSYQRCPSEALVPYSWCPGSYIYGCCNLTKLAELPRYSVDDKIHVVRL